jgi:fructosamine-3-kinase
MNNWKTGVEKLLSDLYDKEVKIISERFVGGGSINDTKAVKTSAGNFFVKINSASRYPSMFEKEAKGLVILKKTQEVNVPAVIGYGNQNDDAFLVLNLIESAKQKKNFWKDFGSKLAALHKHSNSYFGLDHGNYIGSLPQQNCKHDNWEDFFREERLEPQIAMAYNSGSIDRTIVKMFNRFFVKLENIFPHEQPALLHGDLWGGNYMVDENGEAVIIDPAVYYGHREMDLAMSQLFGGFDKMFYESYNEKYPLEPGWKERLDYCNLYPLLVHVNLFGGGYAASVKSILKKM